MSGTGHVYHVFASSVPGGPGTATVNGEVVTFDASANRSEGLPSPADLLTAAFAACVLKNVERFSAVLGFRYQAASIEVQAERQDSPAKIIALRYVLRGVTDEPPHRVDLLHRNIRQFGTIFNTLTAACEVTGVLVADAVPTS